MDGQRKLLVFITFDGSLYHGWQVQQNAVSVQQVVQDALERVLKVRPGIVGCSRTDSGVHANEFAFHFLTDSRIPCESLVKALNVNLPKDIAALRCTDAPADFHARYDVVYKEYIYKIYNKEIRSPFYHNRALFYPQPLDIAAMQQAANGFLGKHDFSSLCAAGSSVTDNTRNVMLSEVEANGDLVIYRVRADGFLYNMVRIMTGTLLWVSQGKIKPDDIDNIINARDRNMAGPTAPPQGLYLNRVFYGG
jgi:tRNA pseudouridine38-40 synthase